MTKAKGQAWLPWAKHSPDNSRKLGPRVFAAHSFIFRSPGKAYIVPGFSFYASTSSGTKVEENATLHDAAWEGNLNMVRPNSWWSQGYCQIAPGDKEISWEYQRIWGNGWEHMGMAWNGRNQKLWFLKATAAAANHVFQHVSDCLHPASSIFFSLAGNSWTKVTVQTFQMRNCGTLSRFRLLAVLVGGCHFEHLNRFAYPARFHHSAFASKWIPSCREWASRSTPLHLSRPRQRGRWLCQWGQHVLSFPQNETSGSLLPQGCRGGLPGSC